ncbi:hypothetical protein FACS189452_02000 [Bacteroidia bacterium]|nr:hypothetical protein FACS189452_02000 [Bacteroidia bacterium]
MKIISIVLCLGLWCATLSAAERRMATPEEAADFFRETTYVVTTNDNIVLDALMLQAVANVWQSTPYKIIGNGAFEDLRTNPKNSFLLVTKVQNSKDKLKRSYLFLNLLLGHPDANKSLDAMPELGSMPLSGDITEPNAFLLEPLLLFLQKNAENISNKMFEKRLLVSFEDRMRAYNKNLEEMRSKTLYVADVQIGGVDKGKFAEKFGEKLVVVPTFDDLEKVVNDKKDNVAIAVSIFLDGGFAYKIAIGLDGTLYYYYREKDAKKFKFHNGDFDMWMRVYQ